MITAEVGRILFVALALINVVVGIVMVWNEFLERASSMVNWLHGEVIEHMIEDIIKNLSDFFGDDGDLDLGHVFKNINEDN